MKKIFILTLFFFGFFLSSCDKTEDPIIDTEPKDVTLNFKAEYNEQALVLFDEYPYGNATLQITQSDFFVSNIILVDEVGVETKIDEVFFIDFTKSNSTMEAALAGLEISLSQIPQANYKKIKFGIGLNSEQNATTPADYTSASPLSKVSHYWTTWDSYIFLKHQGLYTDASQGIEDRGWIWHIGNDALYREVEFSIDLEVNSNPNKLILKLDHLELFQTEQGLFDIIASPDNHVPEVNGAMDMMANNYQNAFSVE